MLTVKLSEPDIPTGSGRVEQVEAEVLTGSGAVEHEEAGLGFTEPGETTDSGAVAHEGEKTASSVIKTRGSRETSLLNPRGEGIFIFQVKSSSFIFITALLVSNRAIWQV